MLLKNEKRHQSKLSPKFRGPLQIAELLDGDRYILRSLTDNRKYKYAHEDIRKLPEEYVPVELESSEEALNGSEKETVERDSNEMIEKETVERDSNEKIEKKLLKEAVMKWLKKKLLKETVLT